MGLEACSRGSLGKRLTTEGSPDLQGLAYSGYVQVYIAWLHHPCPVFQPDVKNPEPPLLFWSAFYPCLESAVLSIVPSTKQGMALKRLSPEWVIIIKDIKGKKKGFYKYKETRKRQRIRLIHHLLCQVKKQQGAEICSILHPVCFTLCNSFSHSGRSPWQNRGLTG